MREHYLPDATYHKLVDELALSLDPITRLPDRTRVVMALGDANIFPSSVREEAPAPMRGLRASWEVRAS